MENNENKTLEERKEEFKEAANQTVPVMGLEEDKTSFSPKPSYTNLDCDNTCISTTASINDADGYNKDEDKDEDKTEEQTQDKK